MTNITLQKQHRTLWHFISGLVLSTVITGVTLWSGPVPAVAGVGFSAPTLAILLGMVLGDTIYPYIWKGCDDGVLLARRYLLCLGIILYDFRLMFSQIADVGISGIIIDVLTLSSTFLLACFLGQKVFDPDRHASWLIGVGNNICSVAAVLMTEPVVKAEASKVTVAVAIIAISGTVATFLYPAIYPLTSQRPNPRAFGIYIGSTVHEVARVVTAGHAVSPDARNIAVISKVLRVMMLAPFPILLVARVKQLPGVNSGEKSRIAVPWSAILFTVVVIPNLFHPLPQSVTDMLVTPDTSLPAMTVVAPDLTIHVSVLKKAGTKPLLMALVLFARLIVGDDAVSYAIQSTTT